MAENGYAGVNEASENLKNATIANNSVEEAEKLKKKANDFFQAQDYEKAIEFYTAAIEKNDSVAAYYGNRSISYLRTECFGYALNDANKALELDKTYLKGYYRRAAANMALGKFKNALRDFEIVAKAKPRDKDAKQKYEECSKITRRIAFEKAIAVDDNGKKTLLESDVDEIAVDASYTGPHLQDKTVDEKFALALLEHFKEQKVLHRKYAYQILLQIKEYFSQQPTMVDVTIDAQSKFTVCGDIHGQFFDLVNVFKLNGLPTEDNPYLFNGDFVDRGSFSVEVILTLFTFKLLYPNKFFMSRGNHESSTMNQMYGFEGEVKSKYNNEMIDLFTEVYNCLPLCHCLNRKVLVMHGGLFGKDNITLDDIVKTERFRQPPEEGIMCDLLWSDPQPQRGRSPSKRGVGIQFGPDITEAFLKLNNLDYVIRSHEVKPDGYEVAHGGKCITVFSAPNYCDTMGNKGAFITFKPDTAQEGLNKLTPCYTTYDAVPHPNVKPMAYANSLLSQFML